MSENQNKTTIHPLVATAAGAVILASVVAVASMTGLFSKSGDKAPESIVAASANVGTLEQTASIPAASVVEEPAPTPAASVVEEPAPVVLKPKPVVAVKPKPKPVTPVAQQQQNQNQQAIPYEKPLCMSCGTVESITSREVKADKGSGIGAVAGAVLGGVLGNQVGGGNGRKLATVAGAIGGGMAGNEIEKRKNSQMVYEVKVMMDNGEVRIFKPNNAPQWRSGDKVKVVDGELTFQ